MAGGRGREVINAVRTAAAVLFLVGYIPLSAVIGFPWTFITGNADVMYGLAMIGADGIAPGRDKSRHPRTRAA